MCCADAEIHARGSSREDGTPGTGEGREERQDLRHLDHLSLDERQQQEEAHDLKRLHHHGCLRTYRTGVITSCPSRTRGPSTRAPSPSSPLVGGGRGCLRQPRASCARPRPASQASTPPGPFGPRRGRRRPAARRGVVDPAWSTESTASRAEGPRPRAKPWARVQQGRNGRYMVGRRRGAPEGGSLYGGVGARGWRTPVS